MKVFNIEKVNVRAYCEVLRKMSRNSDRGFSENFPYGNDEDYPNGAILFLLADTISPSKNGYKNNRLNFDVLTALFEYFRKPTKDLEKMWKEIRASVQNKGGGEIQNTDTKNILNGIKNNIDTHMTNQNKLVESAGFEVKMTIFIDDLDTVHRSEFECTFDLKSFLDTYQLYLDKPEEILKDNDTEEADLLADNVTALIHYKFLTSQGLITGKDFQRRYLYSFSVRVSSMLTVTPTKVVDDEGIKYLKNFEGIEIPSFYLMPNPVFEKYNNQSFIFYSRKMAKHDHVVGVLRNFFGDNTPELSADIPKIIMTEDRYGHE